jgi:RNA polymerase sigma-70 factor (ECF subfamily)
MAKVPTREGVRVDAPERPSAEFEAVYREQFRFVWRCARRLGIEGALVDDVVQDTFLVVHRRLAEFEGRSSTKTWLYGIVRRVVADHRRSLRRKPAGSESDLDAVHDGARGPESSVEHAEQLRLLRRLLAELDEDKREVFILTEFEGMTMVEIAGALDVNANTVSSRLRAARREFDGALERLAREDFGNGITDRRPR